MEPQIVLNTFTRLQMYVGSAGGGRVFLTRRSASLAAEKNQVLCFLLKCTTLKGKTLLEVVSSAALITLQTKRDQKLNINPTEYMTTS